MKKFAVVFGVAAVATFTGCRDQDYVARAGRQVQDEPKSVETTPAPEVQTVTTEVKIEPKAPTPEVKPQPAAPETTTYIVQNGDYLAKISKKYNITIDAIKRLNNLKTDTIRVGQKLKLPGKIDVGEQTVPAKAAPKTPAKKGFAPYTGATKEYVVKNGDTLGAIAHGNGINIRQLKQLNNLSGDALKIGQKLKVPAEKVKKPVEAKKTAEVKPVETEKSAEKPVEPVAQPQPTPPAPEAEAQPTSVEATPPPASVATTTYVVQEGEDLTRLSIDFGVSTSVIREMNNLGENDAIKPGQVLKLPAETQQ